MSNSIYLTGIVGAAICRPRATNSRPYDILVKLPAKFKLLKGQKGGDDGEDDSGEEVGYGDLFAPDQIDTHAEDQDIAHQ